MRMYWNTTPHPNINPYCTFIPGVVYWMAREAALHVVVLAVAVEEGGLDFYFHCYKFINIKKKILKMYLIKDNFFLLK